MLRPVDDGGAHDVGLLAAGRRGRPVGRGRAAPRGDGEARPRAGRAAEAAAVGRHRAPDGGATEPGAAANNEGSVA